MLVGRPRKRPTEAIVAMQTDEITRMQELLAGL